MKPIKDRQIILDSSIQVENIDEFKSKVQSELQRLVDKYIAKFGESKFKPNEISAFPITVNRISVYASFKNNEDIHVRLK